VPPYTALRTRVDGTRATRRGLGETMVRLKYNVWGNDQDDEATAFAVMPYVTLPTARDGLGADRSRAGWCWRWVPSCRTISGWR